MIYMKSFAPLRSIFLSLLLALAPLVLFAQNASLSVLVSYRDGSFIPNASLIIENLEQEPIRQLNTDVDGVFALAIVPPGHYRVTVEHAGFRTVELKDVVLRVGDQPNLSTRQILHLASP